MDSVDVPCHIRPSRPIDPPPPLHQREHRGSPNCRVQFDRSDVTNADAQSVISRRQPHKGSAAMQPGVCCSADECYVAACYWRGGGCGRLVSIVSVGQMHRKLPHFIEFGVYPVMYTVPTFVIAHDPIHEAMQMIPAVLYEDPDLQGPNSQQAIAFRRTRLSDYAATHGLT